MADVLHEALDSDVWDFASKIFGIIGRENKEQDAGMIGEK